MKRSVPNPLFRGNKAMMGLAVLSLLLSGCGGRSMPVGFVADLSGRGSNVGVSARNGALLAAEAANASSKARRFTIRLTVMDDLGTTEGAVEADRALVSQGVKLVVGHATSGPGQAGIPVLQAAGIPILSPLMSAATLTGRKDGFYRIIDENTIQGKVLANAAIDAARRSNRPLRAAVLTEVINGSYTADVKKGFVMAWTEAGGEILREDAYRAEGDIPFDKLAEGLAESGADTCLIVTGGMDLGVLVQKVKALKPDARCYAGMWGMTADFVQHAGSAGDGTVFPSIFDPNATGERWLAFKEQYVAAYGTPPDFAAVYGYEAMQVAIGALEAAGSTDPARIGEALVAGAPWPGLQSDIPMDAYGDSARGYRLMTVVSGTFVPMGDHE